ncbi:MAG: hypothetical protein ACRCVW_03185 [Brevinema sp.]
MDKDFKGKDVCNLLEHFHILSEQISFLMEQSEDIKTKEVLDWYLNEFAFSIREVIQEQDSVI